MQRLDRSARLPMVGFASAVRVPDPLAAYWLRQANVRLRREIAWLWAQRGLLEGAVPVPNGLPPTVPRLQEALNLAWFADDRLAFFAEDEAARHLTGLLAEPPPERRDSAFGAALARCGCTPAESLAVALALAHRLDSAMGSVLAAVANDPAADAPTLALADRLLDEPAALLRLLDPGHAVYANGLLQGAPAGWDAPLAMPPLVAEALFAGSERLPDTLLEVAPGEPSRIADFDLVAARIAAAAGRPATIVPLLGAAGAPLDRAAAALAAHAGLRLVRLATDDAAALAGVAPLLALAGLSLYLPPAALPAGEAPLAAFGGRLPRLTFVGLAAAGEAARLPAELRLPTVRLPPLGFAERLELWREALPAARARPELAAAVAESAARFRFEDGEIARVGDALGRLGRPPCPAEVVAACRADLDFGGLAERIVPRFALEDLVLPEPQSAQVAELVQAMRALAAVHHDWGLGRTWNEAGLAALFAGPPGTGKTMAAEAIAAAVDMPLYRVDLAQVVNKYIGETEKNLHALFDRAEGSDAILFFDEADALFGRRTEVKGANDRYANLQVNYLLQRMERFRGLAILATNRRKDLDEAFLRRLRAAIDFPAPGAAERLEIWRRAIPAGVDASALDLPFLAERLPLVGGHIRSIVLNACLQSARPDGPRALAMPAVVRAARRELEKLGRPASREQFGRYAGCLEEART